MADFVITLIANNIVPLTPEFTECAASMLAGQGIVVEKTAWLATGVACDLFTRHDRQKSLDEQVTAIMRDHPYDAVVQPVAGRLKKLLIADMESTIITCECLDELAELAGIGEKISAITARAMNGELNFEAAIRERMGLLSGLPELALQQVMDEKVRLMPGARELIKAMKKQGAYCMLVSGGFDYFAKKVGKMLGFDEVRCNKLDIADGKLTGRILPPILGKEAKLAALNETCNRMNITLAETLAVGDGANDLPMLLAAGLGVAYHAKPSVRAAAHARIDHADLRALLYAQGIPA